MNTSNPKRRGRARSVVSAFIAALAMIATGLMAMPAAYAAEGDAINIGFGGTLTKDQYTTVSPEIMKGSLTAVGANVPKQGEFGGVTFTGGDQGLKFQPSLDSFKLGAAQGTDVVTAFKAEIEAEPAASQASLATLFSAGGNIFVRYKDAGTLEFGFSANKAGKWTDYKTTATAPTADKKHDFQIEYTTAGDNGKLELLVDGQSLGVAQGANGAKAFIGKKPDMEKTYGFGYEVNPDASGRGFAGKVYRMRLGAAASDWEFIPKPDPSLLWLNFKGTVAGGKYSPAADEKADGTVTFREGVTGPSDGAVTLDGNKGGVAFVANNLTLGTGATVDTPFIAEVRFTPTAAPGSQHAVIAFGGNGFVRYTQAGKLEYGFSYTDSGNKWHNAVQTIAAPALNAEHVISMAYLPSQSSTRVVLYLDNKAQPEVTVNAKAAFNADAVANGTVAFGNDVHPQALTRGVPGKFSEVRVAPTAAATFAASEFKLRYEDECVVGEVTPGNWQDVSSTDCADFVKAKLAGVRPTAQQADFLDHELTAFTHWGINTFYDQEWGHGTEDPQRLNPSALDTDQWAKTYADGGFRIMMLTVKHHDGMLLYDSRYSTFDTENTPAKVDIFRKYVDSAHKYGLGVGLYLSPADSYQEHQGVFGNGSQPKEVQIPTLVANDDRAAKVQSGELPSFKYTVNEYNQYYMNTIYELLTQYGPIDEIWFDGAQGNTSRPEKYDFTAIYDLIRKLQPDCIIANAGPDVRWVGNEGGFSRDAEWSVQAGAINADGNKGRFQVKPAENAKDLGGFNSVLSQVQGGVATKLHWYIAEADGKDRSGWFNTSSSKIQQVDYVVNHMYENSAGRNAILLLNVPPDKRGLLADADVALINGMRQEIDRRYATPDLALGKPATVTVDGAKADAPQLVDGSKLTSDVTNSKTPVYEVNLGKAQSFRYVVLGEDSRNAGQQVEGWKLEAKGADGSWSQIATGPVIGNTRHVVLNDPVTASALRLTVTDARGPVRLTRMEVHAYNSGLPNPAGVYYLDTSAKTPGDGSKAAPFNTVDQLRDLTPRPGSVLYVKRGTTVTGKFWGFGYGTADKPVQVAYYGEGADPVFNMTGLNQGLTGEQMLKAAGADRNGWKVVNAPVMPQVRQFVPQAQIKATASSEEASNPASNVLDRRSETFWESKWSGGTPPLPQSITFDLGQNYTGENGVSALQVVPRFSQSGNSRPGQYEVYVSEKQGEEGVKVASGTMANDSSTTRIAFKPTSGRYVTFKVLSAYTDGLSKPKTGSVTVGLAEAAVEYGNVLAAQEPVLNPVKPDTEALQAAVDAAGALRQADYTVDSWRAFAKALADAQGVLKDPQDQAQVDAALAVLQEAQKALQKKPQVVVLVAPRAVDPGDCVTLAYVTVTPVAGVKYTVTDGAGVVVQPSVGDANRFVYQKSVLQAASVTVRAEVTDAAKYVFADGAQTEWSWSVKARDCQPQVAAVADVPDAVVGTAIAPIAIKAEHAVSVAVAGLPQGLTFDAGKLTVSGTPAEAGEFPVTVTATGVAGTKAASVKFTITVVPDTEALQAAVKDAAALQQSDYTVDSWQAFAKALADAKRVLKDPQDQAQVNDALAALQKAQKALQKKPVEPVKPDTEALQSAVKDAQEKLDTLSAEDYTADSWQAFAKALADAKRVLKDPQDQAQVNDALAALQKAQKALQKKPVEPVKPDTEALQSAVDAAGKLPQSDYTADSWRAFAKALADAKRVLKDPQDQAQVNDALAALQKVQKALQKKPVEPVVPDTEALQSAVDAAGALRQADYTADSWQAFAKALADAKRVLKDPQDQAQVNEALAVLQEAQQALKKAEQPVTPTPDQPDQPTPDQPVTPTPDNPKPVKPGKSDVQRTPDTGASLAWMVFASLGLLSVGGVLAARRRNA